MRSQYVKKCLNLARNLFDLPAVFYFFDDFKGISAGTAGLCGTASSLVSLYGMWGQ